ncbi:MAG: hypothetical protein AAFX09_06740 [Pseudomonadota bacterium]
MNEANDGFTFWFFFWMVVYTALAAAPHLLPNIEDTASVFRLLIALAPILPALAVLRVVVLSTRELDEVQARIQLEAFVISAITVSFACFTWGFMERWLEVPAISVLWVLPTMCGVFGFARLYVSRRYQ